MSSSHPREAAVVERALALSIFGIRLRHFAWGEEAPPTLTREDAGRLAVALDELITLRDQALAMQKVFEAWEFEERQEDQRRADREAAQDARRRQAVERRTKVMDHQLARGLAT